MANFEAFHWNLSSSINLFFLKSVEVVHRYQIQVALKVVMYLHILLWNVVPLCASILKTCNNSYGNYLKGILYYLHILYLKLTNSNAKLLFGVPQCAAALKTENCKKKCIFEVDNY